MKTILTHFSLGLGLIFVLSQAHAQSASPRKSYAESRGQTWLTNYFGKTLSSLGEIVFVRIEHSSSVNSSITNRLHSTAWKIIEHSKIQDYSSAGVALNLPPGFSIEYADGLRIRCTHYTATITLPDGREGLVVLLEQSPVLQPKATAP
jgi:hypothetical protein